MRSVLKVIDWVFTGLGFILLGAFLRYVATQPIVLFSIDDQQPDIVVEAKNVGLRPVAHQTLTLRLLNAVREPVVRRQYWITGEPTIQVAVVDSTSLIKWNDDGSLGSFERGERWVFLFPGEDFRQPNVVQAYEYRPVADVEARIFKTENIGAFEVVLYGSTAVVFLFAVIFAVMIKISLRFAAQKKNEEGTQ